MQEDDLVIEPAAVIPSHTAMSPETGMLSVIVAERVVRGRAPEGSRVRVRGFAPEGFADGSAIIARRDYMGVTGADTLILLRLRRG